MSLASADARSALRVVGEDRSPSVRVGNTSDGPVAVEANLPSASSRARAEPQGGSEFGSPASSAAWGPHVPYTDTSIKNRERWTVTNASLQILED